MTRPDYVSEELWERAGTIATFCDAGIGYRTEAIAEHALWLVTSAIALALLQARNDALREAADKALDVAYRDPSPFDEFEKAVNGGCERASRAILSLIQEPS